MILVGHGHFKGLGAPRSVNEGHSHSKDFGGPRSFLGVFFVVGQSNVKIFGGPRSFQGLLGGTQSL